MLKTPKLYFLDSGLAAWLTGWSSPVTLEAGAMSGAFLETWVVSEVIKSWWHNGKRAPLYYYRDKDTNEVDLLIHQDGTLYPIEIKKIRKSGKRRHKTLQGARNAEAANRSRMPHFPYPHERTNHQNNRCSADRNAITHWAWGTLMTECTYSKRKRQPRGQGSTRELRGKFRYEGPPNTTTGTTREPLCKALA